MDRSREYIELCRGAREIQRLWRPVYGDFYVDDRNGVSCWLCPDMTQSKMKKGYKICSKGNLIQLIQFVWLPRQDQLIEMAQVAGKTYDSITLDFFNWTKIRYGEKKNLPRNLFATLEQIWLAFLMHRKFNKMWDGRFWITGSVGTDHS